MYAAGVKEVWDVPKERTTAAASSTRWDGRLRNEEFGGGFIYNMSEGRVSIGFVVGLDYLDPRLDPHTKFQEFKTHPYVKSILEGGSSIHTAPRGFRKAAIGRSRSITSMVE